MKRAGFGFVTYLSGKYDKKMWNRMDCNFQDENHINN